MNSGMPPAPNCGGDRGGSSLRHVRSRGEPARFPACLGPMPQAALASLIDLGLTDLDIALYFNLDLMRVVGLTEPLRQPRP